MASPQLKANCIALYNILLETAQDGTWEGSLTKAVDEAGIPRGWYQQIVNQLTMSECILLVQRGNSKQPTIINLIKSPAEGEWQEIPRKHLTRPGRPATLEGRVQAIEKRLGGLDVAIALEELWQEVNDLKGRIDAKKS